MRGIEVGHIFKLGTKYSEVLEANYLDQKGQEKPMVMGCYGIGISRTMAAAVEQSADENGIVWPLPITPFEVIIVPVNSKNEEQMQAAWSLYEEFKQEGLETIIDDRDERAGVVQGCRSHWDPLRIILALAPAENRWKSRKEAIKIRNWFHWTWLVQGEAYVRKCLSSEGLMVSSFHTLIAEILE